MELIRYLERYFLTREQLLAQSAIDAAQLERMQLARLMPLPSYRLRLDLGCASFFGEHQERRAVDYYATGYNAWLVLASPLPDEEAARALFSQRYRARLADLGCVDCVPRDPAFASEAHLRAEWNAFLDGTYGLCTVSGLPEDIAAKEAAIALIRELAEVIPATGEAPSQLLRAVDLLDNVTPPFAPHEVARSSRRRYVDEARARFGIMPPVSASPSTGQPCPRSRCPAGPAS